MKATDLVKGKRYQCSCANPLKGLFCHLDKGEPVFLVGPRAHPVYLDYRISSCLDGWKEIE